MVTTNIAGFSYGQTGSSKSRFAQVVKLIKYLLLVFSIVIIQETNLLSSEEVKALGNSFEGCDIQGNCSNNSSTARAGVMIITGPSINSKFDIHTTSLSGSGRGRVMSNKYSPKPNYNHLDSFRVTNVYLQSGTSRENKKDKKDQIHSLLDIPNDTSYEYVGGDFNIMSRRNTDITSEQILQDCMSNKGLEEVHQHEHTCYRMDRSNNCIVSSKIDRWFSNHSVAQSAVLQEEARVVSNAPFTVGRYRKNTKMKSIRYIPNRKDKNAKHVTDHQPVGLRVRQNKGGVTKGISYKKKVIYNNYFSDTINTRWEEEMCDYGEANGFTKLTVFKELITSTYKEATKHNRNKDNEDSKLDRALRLYKYIMKNNPSDTEIAFEAGKYGELCKLVDNSLPAPADKTKKLVEYIDQNIDRQFQADVENTGKVSRAERLSKAFPKERQRISALRDEEGSFTEDPNKMANIAHGFWQKHFEDKNLKVKKLPRYLRRHYKNKKISEEVRKIDLQNMKQIIMESGDTAPGPDGVPFFVYRRFVDLVAPIFCEIIELLKEDKVPPDDFNTAIFHLLPKKGTGWISDTRPLSVSNTYNRIIATAIKWAIQPAILSVIGKEQCGFWPGKTIEQCIDFFNETFYKAYDENKEYSVMLFDIAKAFDSVSHKTIIAVLKHIGIPEEYVKAIAGLFKNIQVKTNFGGMEQVINIFSGIKQGCPLSPLLFILVMDILLSMIKKHTKVDSMMYCDDTAAGATDMSKEVEGLEVAFRLFQNCTNMKLNTTKTVLLTTLQPAKRGQLRKALEDCGWNSVKTQEVATYLGIPLGRPPGAEIGAAFRERAIKIQKRLKRYLPHKNNLSLVKRIALFNIFILTLFSYPMKFFTIPGNHLRDLKSDMNGWIGHSIATEEYTRPQCCLGLRKSAALICPQTYNLAILASRAKDTDENVDLKFTTIKRGRKQTKDYTWSMRSVRQKAYALWFIEATYGIRKEDIRGKNQSIIYQKIVNSDYYKERSLEHVRKATSKWGLDEEEHKTLISNHTGLSRWVPDYAMDKQIHLVHNALPTDCRLIKINKESANRGSSKRTHVQAVGRCYLCKNEQFEDDTYHIFSNCAKIREALGYFRWKLGTHKVEHIQRLHNYKHLTLCSQQENRAIVGLQYIFNSAIWYVRENIKNGRSVADVPRQVWNELWDRVKKHAPECINDSALIANNFSAEEKKEASSKIKSFGSASNRSEEQKQAAKQQAERDKQRVRNGDIEIWTDGSSLGNPGPAGAGATIQVKGIKQIIELSYALGDGTNNLAELWAIGGALETVRDRNLNQNNNKIYIFSDSKYAINTVKNVWYSRSYFYITDKIRNIARKIKNKIIYIKVAGHADIAENDKADELAKMGANHSNYTNIEINHSNIIKNSSFNICTI